MAVAAPVLERTLETEETRRNVASQQEADAIHDALIKERYARLINPESSLSQLKEPIAEEPVVEERPAEVRAEAAVPAPAAEVVTEKTYEPYFVTNARADSDLFRADSFINRRQEVAEVQSAEQEDEDDEDLRPTLTTIQYKTTAVKDSEEGEIKNVGARKSFSLSKRDKITIAAVITVIVALFVLIIVNSAIISGLNSDLTTIRASLSEAQEAARSVNEAVKSQQAVLDQTARSIVEGMGYLK